MYNSAPCYFPTNECSIVTATRLNFCVRYGNRCFPRAMGTDFDASLLRQTYGFSQVTQGRNKFDFGYSFPFRGQRSDYSMSILNGVSSC